MCSLSRFESSLQTKLKENLSNKYTLYDYVLSVYLAMDLCCNTPSYTPWELKEYAR